MSALPFKKVDRNQIYREIAQLIESSPDKEAEISSSELADRFGVESPTMDYHLKKLVTEGYLAVSPKRGRYNRKIYRLPVDAKAPKSEEPSKTKVHKPFENPESASKFQQFLQEHKQKSAAKPVQEKPVKEKYDKEKTKEEQPPVHERKPMPQPQPDSVVNTPVQPKPAEPVQVKELTLDEKIQRFLNDANRVHDANVLLSHEDKEILSVMNETIQQNIVYLKDLSEQLSTLQNKELIQGLLDDRNRMQEQLKRAEEEAKQARAQADQTIQKYEVDPQRVRFMHQLIIDTVDQYVKLPNHAMALGRQDFRKKVSKEVSDLVKYVLHLEE